MYGTRHRIKVRNPGQRWVYAWIDFARPEVLAFKIASLDRYLLSEWGYVDKNREWGVDGPMEAFVGLEPDE